MTPIMMRENNNFRLENICLNIICEDPRWKIEDFNFEDLCKYTLNVLEFKPSVEINLLLTNNEKIQFLNKTFRHKNKPTDVLSFPLMDQDEILKVWHQKRTHAIIGDIALGLEYILEEATNFHHHVLHLFTHGLLHLFGYDHMTSEEAKEMEDVEIKILHHLNIPNPYI